MDSASAVRFLHSETIASGAGSLDPVIGSRKISGGRDHAVSARTFDAAARLGIPSTYFRTMSFFTSLTPLVFLAISVALSF